MKTKNMTLISLMIALLAIFAQFSLPIGPVAITLQTFIILLVGALLSPKNALITTSLYLIIGLVGIPVFTGFTGGLQSIFLPSFGFILAWIPATTLQAFYLRKKEDSIRYLTISFLLNYFVTYLIGLSYMRVVLTYTTGKDLTLFEILSVGLIPFIIGDIFKILIARILVQRIRKHLMRI